MHTDSHVTAASGNKAQQAAIRRIGSRTVSVEFMWWQFIHKIIYDLFEY